MDDITPESIRALTPGELYSLDGRVAIVTGAAGGIGRWLAAGLGVAGARVLLTDIADAGLEEVREVLAATGVSVATATVDLTELDAPSRIVDAAVDEFGGVDILVNNAGYNRRMPILEMDTESYEQIVHIDLRVPYFLSQEAARVMKDRGGGAILNVTSVNAFYGLEQISVYGPAKAGLSQLTRVQALEWAEHGIRSNALAPGFMDTPLATPVWEDRDMRRWILNRVPIKRPGRPDELVGLCLLLVSDAGSFVTGQTFCADGGFLAGGRWFTPDE